MDRKALSIFMILVLLSSVVASAAMPAASAQVAGAQDGADKIKVKVKLGSMNFKLTPSGDLFSQYDWGADWGDVEPGGPDVVVGSDVRYVSGSKTSTNEYSLIDQAEKRNADGSYDGLRVWFGPPNTTTGFTNYGTSPFNYPQYPDTSRPAQPEYPITLVEFEECTPMDNVILHVWVAESDSSTANTAVGLLTGLAGVVLTGIGLAAEAPSVGTSTGIASLGVGLIGLASGIISGNGDEDWGRASDVKNAPGRYTITTQNGADGQVNLDWAIETEVIEEDSPDCRDQKTSLFVPGSSQQEALAYFGAMRDLESAVAERVDENGSGAISAEVLQAVNSAQREALAKSPGSSYAVALTEQAQSMALDGRNRDALSLYEAAFLAAIEPDGGQELSASASVMSTMPLAGSMAETIDIANTGKSPVDMLLVKSPDGELNYVYAAGWQRQRLAHDAAIMWTAIRPIGPGESVSLVAVTGGQGADLLFHLGSNSTISGVPVAIGPHSESIAGIIGSALPAGDGATQVIKGKIGEFAFPSEIRQGRIEQVTIGLDNVNEGYLEVVVDADEPFHGAGEIIVTDRGTGSDAEFAINESGQMVGRLDVASGTGEVELDVKVLHGAPVGTYEMALFLHGQDGSIHDTAFAQIEVLGEYKEDGGSPVQHGSVYADPAELSFSHKVGVTECPQYIGSVFLNSDREGRWTVAGQPGWLAIDLAGDSAQVEFNCEIEDTSEHEIEDSVSFLFEGEDGSSDEIAVAVNGQIIAPGQEEDYEIFAIDCMGGANAGGTSLLSDADREKYSKVEGNLTQLTQPTGSTCSPTSGAIDILHWNATVAPGIVNGTVSKLISELAEKMKTTGTGTKSDQIAVGMAQYFEEHAKGKFDVKFVYKSTKTKTVTKTVGGAKVPFSPQDTITVLDLASEMDRKANVIVNVEIVGTGGHSVKLMALNTSSKDGRYNVAFVNPGNGKIMQGTMDFDGNIEAGSDDWKIKSYVAISPK